MFCVCACVRVCVCVCSLRQRLDAGVHDSRHSDDHLSTDDVHNRRRDPRAALEQRSASPS